MSFDISVSPTRRERSAASPSSSGDRHPLRRRMTYVFMRASSSGIGTKLRRSPGDVEPACEYASRSMLRALLLLAVTVGALAAAPEAHASAAERLVRADAALQAAIARWQGRGPIPPAVSRTELVEQRLELALASSQRLAAATIPGLPPALRARVRDDLAAHEELARLTPPQPLSAFKTGPARPANELLADFRRAELRFGVPWNVLAAVNLVESGFGRLRNDSVS